MLQNTMLELKDKAKGFLMVKQNHVFKTYRIMNSKSEILPSAKTTSKEKYIHNNIGENGSSTNIFESEETVFAAPEQNRKFNKGHRLIVLSGDSPDKTYLLYHPKMMIGRDQSSHIRIYDKTVSLYHAMIFVKANECILKDLDSKNGTLVNGARIKDSLKLKDGDKIEIGSTIFTFVHGDLDHLFGVRQLLRKKRYIAGVFTIACIVLAIFIFLYQVDTGDARSGAPVEQKNMVENNSPAKKNMSHSTEADTAQQEPFSGKEKSISLDEKGQQLAEKALHQYVNGNIAMSLTMLEETLQLNLPDDSALKTKALAIKDTIVNIYMLYKEGFKHYNKSNMGQAIEFWSQALKADKEIVGQASSHFANQIASHTGDIFYKMAQDALKKGNNKQAQEFCSQTFRAMPNHKGCIAILNTL